MTGRELYERWARYADDCAGDWTEVNWLGLPGERQTAWEDLAAWLGKQG